jgi:hypothetical protein
MRKQKFLFQPYFLGTLEFSALKFREHQNNFSIVSMEIAV